MINGFEDTTLTPLLLDSHSTTFVSFLRLIVFWEIILFNINYPLSWLANGQWRANWNFTNLFFSRVHNKMLHELIIVYLYQDLAEFSVSFIQWCIHMIIWPFYACSYVRKHKQNLLEAIWSFLCLVRLDFYFFSSNRSKIM